VKRENNQIIVNYVSEEKKAPRVLVSRGTAWKGGETALGGEGT